MATARRAGADIRGDSILNSRRRSRVAQVADFEALKVAPEAFEASLEQYQSLGLDGVKRRLWSDRHALVVGAF